MKQFYNRSQSLLSPLPESYNYGGSICSLFRDGIFIICVYNYL